MAESKKIRFGVYELDTEAMELRKHGMVLKLQEQPFRVLALLASRPGELVTREELRAWIWGDTFVDFDQSLNKAINRAREALHDDPATPQYIETIPRRGYRFIAPVAITPTIEEAAPPVIVEPLPQPETQSAGQLQKENARLRKRTVIVAIGTVTLLALFALGLQWQRGRESRVQESAHLIALGWQPTLSQDGKLVAYLDNTGGGPFHIWVKQTAGGEAIPVTRGQYPDYQPSFSPDGTRIAFGSGRNGRGLFITPTFPGEARLLVANPEADFPAFSPRGDSILFNQQQKAFLVSPDGGPLTPLALNKTFSVYGPLYWSPDGRKIIFYGAHNWEKSTEADWWITPVEEGQPQLAHVPGVKYDQEPQLMVRGWVRSTDDREWIFYSTSEVDSWHLWRALLSSHGTLDDKPQLLAEGNGSIAPMGSMIRDGSLVYPVMHPHGSIYQIRIDESGRKLGPMEDLLLHEGSKDGSPSLSRDGRWMAYDSAVPGEPDSVRLRDLTTGVDHLLDKKDRAPGNYRATAISPDGSRVLFTAACKPGTFTNFASDGCGFQVAAQNGEPEQICDCTPRGFSSDGSFVLMQKYDTNDHNRAILVAFDLKSRQERAFFRPLRSGPWLYHPYLSWDDHWVVFKKMQPMDRLPSQIFIAPVRDGFAGDESTWIPITDTLHADDKPQFSADGNTVFYTSSRDGYLCIYGQRLNPLTKRPAGSPFAFEHIHNAAGRAGIILQEISDLSVARNKMLINLWEGNGDIWMMRAQ